MSASTHGARVLIAVADAGSDVSYDVAGAVADLKSELDVEPIVKRGTVASEYLAEFGPTLDCVVALSQSPDCVENLVDADPTVPLVVYSDEVPSVPVDAVVATDGGVDALAGRVRERIGQARERDRLLEANAKLTALGEYAGEITACETVEEVCERAFEAVTEALAFDRCALGMLGDDGEIVYPRAVTPSFEDLEPISVDRGVVGRTLRTGEPEVIEDFQEDPDYVATGHGLRGGLSVPIGDRGAIEVASVEPEAFDERDLLFIEVVAAQATEALARLEREATLRAERDRLYALFDGMPDPAVYVVVEDSGRTVEEVNRAYERQFDVVPTEVAGRPVEEAFSTPEERTLFGGVGEDDPVERRVTRETATDEATFDVQLVPVERTDARPAAYGVYSLVEA